MRITIYHNPRCSKSRATLELLESRGVTPRIVHYLETPPDAATLVGLATRLGLPLEALLRRGEAPFVEAGDDVPLDDEAALAAWMSANPRVIERPVVVEEDSGRAVIGRPPDNVLTLLD